MVVENMLFIINCHGGIDFLYGNVIAFKRAHRWFDVKGAQFEGAQ